MITHAWTTLATVVSIAVGGLWLSAGSGATMLGMSGDDTFDQLRERAERAFAEGSYRQALEIYTQAADLELSPSEKRWVSFRIGDSTWRNEAATQTNDESNYDKARKQLQAVLDSYKTESARDELWAMTQRSLGDFWWDRQYSQNWGQGWQHYNQALDFWAGSRDLDKARAMYLDIIFSAAEPSWINNNPWYRQYVQIPANVLDNAVEIAEGDEDRSHAEYLLAMALRQQGGIRQHLRAEELFKSVISTGKTYAWYDDALFYYAEWLSQQGRPTRLESGEWTYKAQYKTAVEQYQHILDEFRKGETAYFDQAKERITSITSPTLNASVGQVYLPGSENQFDVHWRNIGQIDVKMYAVDLTTAIRYPERSQNQEAWVNQIDISGAAIARSMIIDTEDKGDHAPGSKQVRLEEPLEPGAYLLVAAGGGQSARDLLLVSDAAVVLTAVADRTLVYACDAIDGSPLANAAVTLWEVRWVDVRNNRSQYVSKRHEGVTDEHGLAEFKLTMPRGHGQLIATARLEARQALAQVSAGSLPDEGREYRVYAVTDRPAYKPGDDVQWKVTARVYRDSIYETPANQSVKYQVLDPRGSSLKESTLKLNEFGSAWDVLELGTDVALGEYQVQFWTADGNNWIGSATLFRTEEYKLPEFEVTVKPASEDDSDKPRVFQLGDVVDVEIDAQYYFGAPVANADVELVIYQKNFWYRWQEPREYPWLYEDSSREDWRYYDQGQIIKRESLKTDETGKAVVSFETPLNANQDFEYTIEARVVDSSRREVSSSKTVRVTRQKYFVNAKSKHNIHAHGSEIAIEFQARDANSQPVEAEGLVEVFRDEWIEIWITPDGREITGDELAGTRASMRHFPPTPGPNELGWRLKFRGYKSERVLSQKVATDVEGNATFEFTPRQAGYYRITWLSEKLDMYPIRAETAVWVVDDADRAIGYYQGGVEIIVDKDTFHAGQSAPAMISVPTNNRYVLLTVEGNTLHHHQLVHVPGMVKLVTINVTDAMIPNVWLNVAMVDNGQMYTDQAEIVVPPVEHFLTTEVKMNQDNYIPGETGSLTVNTKDHDGHPVSADVTLQVVDESVYTIQQELAGDPREFFFSDRQWQQVQHNSSFGIKPYRKLLENESGDVVWVEDLRADGAPAAPMDDANEALVTDSMENAPSRRTRGESDRMMVDAAMPSAPSASPRPGGGGMGGGGGPESMQMMKQDFQGGDEMRSGGERQNAQPADLSNVRVRSDFRETALWVPSVITDASGTATVDVSFPDSTSRWKVQGRAATTESAFGIAESTVRTRQPLIVRVQAPRFFTVGDETVISAVINNNTDKDQETTIEGKVEGLAVSSMKVKGDATGRDAAAIVVTIPANDSVRIDWNVVADAAGEAIVIVRAGAGEHTDGMERRYTVHDHGIEKHVIVSGKARENDVSIKLDLPAERRDGTTSLSVQITPSLAVSMLDALPYLIDYPYGCTEQTMSRFLPAVIVAKTLEDLGVDPAIAMSGVLGGIEQEHVEHTQPNGRRDLAKLDEITSKGLERLADFQQGDGGWGWWKTSSSDHYMTAYVVWGLALAKNAGVELPDGMLERGIEYLRKELVEEERNYDMQAWMLHALAIASATANRPHEFEQKAIDNLWSRKDQLNAFTRALFALAVHSFGDNEKANVLVRNLENGVKLDETPDTSVVMRAAQQTRPTVMKTAHWGADGIWYRWSSGPVETTAFVLRALLAIEPEHKLIEPTTNWLIKNRRGAQWSNTRDTAIAVLTLTEYLKTSGELEANVEYELLINGKSIARKTITPADLFTTPSRFEIDAANIQNGANDIRIVRHTGDAPLYFAADATFFSKEEPITAAGHEMFVRRDYYKLVPYPTLLKGFEFDRVPLKDGDSVTSGERVQVVVTIESKNDYEYMLFEDLKPAGLEAVQVQSGIGMHAKELRADAIERRFAGEAVGLDAQDVAKERDDYTGRTTAIYQELRTRHVAMFIDRLPQGTWELAYELRAEAPGEFHALPIIGHAMYVPEIRCNSRELRMTVYDRPE